jgi:hypothetical protein
MKKLISTILIIAVLMSLSVNAAEYAESSDMFIIYENCMCLDSLEEKLVLDDVREPTMNDVLELLMLYRGMPNIYTRDGVKYSGASMRTIVLLLHWIANPNHWGKMRVCNGWCPQVSSEFSR